MSESLETVACEAALAINQAVGDLLLPRHIFRLFTGHEEAGHITSGYATAMRRLAMQVIAINLFRLWEARENLLCPWLFREDELRAMGLPRIEEFGGRWSAFLTVRHQYAGHMLRREAEAGRPGQLLPPEVFGRALQESGLWDAGAFLARVEEQIVPAVERVRAELFRRWPAAEEYVRRIYPDSVKRGAGGDPPSAECKGSPR
jgi:hypothetical protein